MDALKHLVTPFVGSSGLVDGVKLVVLGGTVETARRISSSAWSHFVNSFFLTAHFSEEDYPFDWLMHWLAKQPAWQKSREFETTTRTTTVGLNPRAPGSGDEDPDDDQDDPEDELTPGKQKVKVVFQPTFDTTLTIFYKGHWLRVRRSKKPDNSDVEVLSISVVARSNTILKQLVLQAKREYEADAVHRIQIYFADSHGSWRWTDSRHKRPMSSIVLQPGVKEMLLADARDFLRSEKWYADRGIPFRRGFLLFGVPGSGKTSLIHAIAGELSLDIYVVSLSSSWMTDSTLTTLMGRVPARCILLLEDLDAAFTRSTSRDSASTGAPAASGTSGNGNNNGNNNNNGGNSNNSNNNSESNSISDLNTLSLSGLLNAIDGVAAAEGRILFATTNHLERLDPALSRPGRMDVWVEFKNASKWQAEQLFRNFFPSAADISEEDEELAAAGVGPGAFDATPLDAAGAAVPVPAPTTFSAVSGGRFEPDAEKREDSNTSSAPAPAFVPPTLTPLAGLRAAALDSARLAELARTFAAAIPDDEFSVAALQGYLLKNKSRPEAAAGEAAAWVVSERELRERLAREKEARERKEREERERRRREERERREREEREREEREREREREREKKDKKDAEKDKEKDKKDEEKKDEKKADGAGEGKVEEKGEAKPEDKGEAKPEGDGAKDDGAKDGGAQEVVKDGASDGTATPAPGDDAKENVWIRVPPQPAPAPAPEPAPAQA